MDHKQFLVPPGKPVRLKNYDASSTGKFNEKDEASEKLERDVRTLAALQDTLYAQNTYALLLIFQGMDAAGKDGAIEHVMSGVNPQGCQVVSFKAPSAEELDHDYLWRCMRELPQRGRIGIFNRSYYEEVLIVRVHPEILHGQRLPEELLGKDIWKKRFEQINHFEKYLVQNGVVVLKFFLHVSKKEQKKRFLERIDEPGKNWKFSPVDVKERERWRDYMEAYEEAMSHTSTAWAPWYVIPADKKWFTRVAIADIIVTKLQSLKLRYPILTADQIADLAKARTMLESEQ